MGPVQAALRELAGMNATGALHVEAGLGAVLYLREGQVTHVDAAASPGIGRVLLASGRLPEKIWGAAINAGARIGRVGPILVEQGHLSQGELELSVIGALHDAAFFALNTEPTAVRFANGETAWFGSPLGIPVDQLIWEADRRRDRLAAALPTSAYDNVPFAPAPRLPRFQIVMDALRWELLVNADGRRTPLELARLLGRGGYATLLEVRRLAAAGLLRLPDQGSDQPAPATPGRPGQSRPGPGQPGQYVSVQGLPGVAEPGRTQAGGYPRPGPTTGPLQSGIEQPGIDQPGGDRPGLDQPGAGRPVGGQGGPSLGDQAGRDRTRSSQGGPDQAGNEQDAPGPDPGREAPVAAASSGFPDEEEKAAATEPPAEDPKPPLPRRRVGGWRRNSGPGERKGDESRWVAPPPEVRTEPPSISMLSRFRDALEGLR